MEMNFLTVKDLTDMGFGNRVTIWKKVKQHEFPAPMKFGASVNSPNRWLQEDIENYVDTMKLISRSKKVNYGNQYFRKKEKD